MPGPKLLVGLTAAAVIVAAVAIVVVSFAGHPYEQVVLVNDGPRVLRLDGCSLDGIAIPPGRFPTPIALSSTLICPVYQNRDALYLGCLILRRDDTTDGPVPIMQTLRANISRPSCDTSWRMLHPSST